MQSAEIIFCDRCNSSIPESAIENGSAVLDGGRGFCKDCRSQIEDSSFGDQVHFCDQCNVSISVAEIREGAASFQGGKLYCEDCATSSVGPAGAASGGVASDTVQHGSVAYEPATRLHERTRRESRVVRIVAVLAVLFVTGILSVMMVFFPDRFPLGGGKASTGEGAAASAVDPGDPGDSETVATIGSESGDESDEGLSSSSSTSGPASSGEVDRLTGVLAGIEARLENLERAAAADTRGDERFAVVEDSIRDLEARSTSALEALGSDLSSMRALLESMSSTVAAKDDAAVAATGAVGDGVAEDPVSEEPPAAAGDPELDAVLADLVASEAGKRFSALVELGRRGDAGQTAAVAEVLLNDEDFVVREFAANVLGNFGVPAAVAPLITALRDPAPSVVMASDEALRRITRKNFGMKRRSSASAREDVVRKWEAWWKKNADSYES